MMLSSVEEETGLVYIISDANEVFDTGLFTFSEVVFKECAKAMAQRVLRF